MHVMPTVVRRRIRKLARRRNALRNSATSRHCRKCVLRGRPTLHRLRRIPERTFFQLLKKSGAPTWVDAPRVNQKGQQTVMNDVSEPS
jgi:hypothetical protein